MRDANDWFMEGMEYLHRRDDDPLAKELRYIFIEYANWRESKR